MTDDYEYIVECERFLVRNHKKAYFRTITLSNDDSIKREMWLRIMGLIETWDMRRHR